MGNKAANEKSRGDTFTTKVKTKICLEEASSNSPWVAKNVHWRGFSQKAMMKDQSYTDVIWLLIRGELPTSEQSSCFERLFIMLSCPSPRAPEARAVMNAAIGKTHFEHWLPIGLNVANGSYGGTLEVYEAMRFIQKSIHNNTPPDLLARTKLKNLTNDHPGEITIAPGFGTNFGKLDTYASTLINEFPELLKTLEIQWAKDFVDALSPHAGWRTAGVTAAVLASLQFTPIQASGLFQMAIMPGLLAYADEKSGQPLTEMPFLSEAQYSIKMPTGEIK
ncbi:MAG: citrate synthase [Colwellia sp.]|jgi:citrate synthase